MDVFEELQQLAREETFVDQIQILHAILDNITWYEAGNPDSAHKGVAL
jgi:hypothetical protein